MKQLKYGIVTTLLFSALSAEAALSITTYSMDHLPYQRKVTMSANEDTANAAPGDPSMSFNVGGWSWSDLGSGKNPNKGWGHTTDWILVELLDSTNVTFYQTLNPGDLGSDNIAPGFTIYSGEKTTGDFSNGHTYSNNGLELSWNDGWDTGDELTFFEYGSSLAAEDISESWFLPAGLYTIAIGNQADSALAPSAVDYDFRIVTAVPEPSTYAMLGGIAALGLALMRRRFK